MQQGGSSDYRSRDERIQSAERLFSEYNSHIRSVIRFFIRDEWEREDMYQELFMFFVRKPVSEDVRNVKGFLYRVIADRIKDQRRKQARYQKRIEKYADVNRPAEENIEDGFSAVFQKEQIEQVYSLVRKYLTENEATAIRLRFQDDCDIPETAKRMKVQPKTVSRYVCVGLKKIRTLLQKMERAKDEGE